MATANVIAAGTTKTTGSTPSMSATAAFSQRHIGPSDSDVQSMLHTIGLGTLDELIAAAVPASILDPGKLTFGPALSDTGTIDYLPTVPAKNTVLTPLIVPG